LTVAHAPCPVIGSIVLEIAALPVPEMIVWAGSEL